MPACLYNCRTCAKNMILCKQKQKGLECRSSLSVVSAHARHEMLYLLIKTIYGPYLQNLHDTEVAVVCGSDKKSVGWAEIPPDDGSHFS